MAHLTRIARTAGCLAVSAAVSLAGGAPVLAANPVGTCPDSYSPLTREQFVALGATPEEQQLFAEVFDIVNKNGDAVACFKFYPNGLHHGHAGNIVDNNAAPHQ